ncbi:MAG: orotate phosphoribosyltransferase, partial [Planctomycetota bacterium]|nr:orotate phosphoribosyltransferase [Planctomycetota bacterium]
MDDETRKALAGEIAAVSVLRGQFTLRSGRTSSYYLDKYLFSTRPEILRQLGQLFAERIPSGTDRLAGAELGGIPLVSAASIESGIPCIFIRNSKKEYGTSKQLEGALERGDRVVLLEDVATTGGQALEAVEIIRS